MKKIIYFLALLLTLYTLNTQYTHSQDSYLDIGSMRLRYDADSNLVRFGKRPQTGIGNLRLAKEFDSQLFKFNDDHFTWSAITGLNLNTGFLNRDSILTKNMTIGKDTTWFCYGRTIN